MTFVQFNIDVYFLFFRPSYNYKDRRIVSIGYPMYWEKRVTPVAI